MTGRRSAIVTGGTRGIGLAISRRLCADGLHVAATYRADNDAARSLEAELGDAVRAVRLDGRDATAVRAFVAGFEDKPIDVLVCNAGISHAGLSHQVTSDDVERVFSANLFQSIHFATAVLPGMMRRRRGDIVMIGSLAAGNLRAGNGLYGASKAALERYALSAAFEAARFDVAVNIVAPGFVRTALSEDALTGQREREILAALPTRRLTTPDEVADAVSLLVGRRPLLVGIVLPVGGGGHL